MVERARLLTTTPLIPTGGPMAEALRLFTDELGFAIVWQDTEMAGVARDGVAFNLVQNDNRTWAENASFSIGVSDLDALYAEYRELPSLRIKEPREMPWGRREMHILLPSQVCLQFYASAG